MNKTLVRLVLAVSIDGRITFSNGSKASLGGKGDRKVLEESLAWSDATLMGRGTLEAHQNTCLIHSPKLLSIRKSKGKSLQPISLIATSKGSFSENWEYFDQPITRWILSPKKKSNHIYQKGFDRHFLIRNTWAETFHHLKKEGCHKIALLGGRKLIQSILLEDNIDELQFTLTPRILGGNYTWVDTSGTMNLPINLTESKAWILKEIKILEGNELMIQYSRNRK